MNEIKLGSMVKDLTSGLTGIAINRNVMLNGTVQYNVQPQGTKAVPYPDAMSIDYHMLKVVSKGISEQAPKTVKELDIPLGSKVKCMISEFEGIAVCKTFYLNGCIAFLVQGKADEKTGTSFTEWVDQSKLEVISDGILPKYKKPAPNDDGVATGGASVRGIPRF